LYHTHLVTFYKDNILHFIPKSPNIFCFRPFVDWGGSAAIDTVDREPWASTIWPHWALLPAGNLPTTSNQTSTILQLYFSARGGGEGWKAVISFLPESAARGRNPPVPSFMYPPTSSDNISRIRFNYFDIREKLVLRQKQLLVLQLGSW
jgi:hypothetical protein